MNARIWRLNAAINRVRAHIEFCRYVGDAPEDYADLTEEERLLWAERRDALRDARALAAKERSLAA